ncbi:MAG TPA: ferritin-like domain-containing protein [Burkholderiaceae bacterium]
MGSKFLFSEAPAPITRRRGLFTLGALAAAGLAQSAFAKGAAGNGDAAILNAALALEFQAIAAYQVGAESKLLDKPVFDLAVQFQSHHKAHASALTVAIEQSGGVAVESKTIADYAFPVDQLKSQADVLRFAAGLEKAAASAYVNSLANLRQKNLIKGAAAILGDETMHWAVLLQALGENPVPAAFIS